MRKEYQKNLLLGVCVCLLVSIGSICFAKDLMRNGERGAWCRIDYGIPYYFQNVGTEPLTITYDTTTKKYSVQGKAEILPVGKIKTNEQFSLPSDEGSIAKHIDKTSKLDWGNLPKQEIDQAQESLSFCRAVAQYEAKKKVTEWETIDGEPAMQVFGTDGSMKGSWGGFGTDLRFSYVGPGAVQMHQLKPSGRFRVIGTVKVEKTGAICKNGWIDKNGAGTSTEE